MLRQAPDETSRIERGHHLPSRPTGCLPSAKKARRRASLARVAKAASREGLLLAGTANSQARREADFSVC